MKGRVDKQELLNQEIDRFLKEKDKAGFTFTKPFLAAYERKDTEFLKESKAPEDFVELFKKVSKKPAQPTVQRGGRTASPTTEQAPASPTTARPTRPVPIPAKARPAAPPPATPRAAPATPPPATPRARPTTPPPVSPRSSPPPSPRGRSPATTSDITGRERRAAPVPPPIPSSTPRRKDAPVTEQKAASVPPPVTPTVEQKTPPPLPKIPPRRRADTTASTATTTVASSVPAPPPARPPLVTGVEKLGEPVVQSNGYNRHRFKGTVIGNRFYVGDKPFGMEPGCLGVKVDTELVEQLRDAGLIDKTLADEALEAEYRSPAAREAALVELVAEEMATLHQLLNEKELLIVREEKKLPSMVKMARPGKPLSAEDAKKIERLEQFTKTLRTEGMSGVKKMSLLKQIYTEDSISPPVDRLRNTTRGKTMNRAEIWGWKKVKESKSSRTEENSNAIGETFGNAIAGAYAMPSQKQYMLISSYDDGSLKIITDCEWQPGLKGMTDQLAGEKYQSYFVDVVEVETADGRVLLPKKTREDPPFYQSSLNQINHAAQNLAMFLIQADDDCFGSKLQNKMVIGEGDQKELYGIDFGHAYRDYDKANPLVDNLSIDFTLDDETQKKYKNVSILFDAPPTDKLLGLFYTFKSMHPDELKNIYSTQEIKQINDMIDAYKKYYADSKPPYPEFARRIDEIQPGAVETIFNAYETEFKKLIAAEQASPSPNTKKITELTDNLAILRQKAAYHTDNSRKLLTKFKGRMQMTPAQVTLLDNLAKLTSETRSTDKEGVVALNHLQILANENRIEWDLSPWKDGAILLTANIPAGVEPSKIKNLLQDYADMMKLPIGEIHIAKGQVTLEVPKDQIQAFSESFSEKFIKNLKPLIAPDLTNTPELITINQKIANSALLVRNLSLLTSLTNQASSGELYQLGDKRTDTHWAIKETKNDTFTLNAKVHKKIGAKKILKLLLGLTKGMKPPPKYKFSRGLKTGEIEIICDRQQIEELMKIFSEENIKKLKHNPSGDLRQLVLYSKKMDNIAPGTEQLLTHLTTLSAAESSSPEKNTWTATQTDAGTYVIQSDVTDNTEQLLERWFALKIKNVNYSINEEDGRVVIECANEESLKKLIQAVNQHPKFNPEVAAQRNSFASTAPLPTTDTRTRAGVTPPPPPSPKSRDRKQSTSAISRLLRLPLQRSQNNLKVDEVPAPVAKTPEKAKAPAAAVQQGPKIAVDKTDDAAVTTSNREQKGDGEVDFPTPKIR